MVKKIGDLECHSAFPAEIPLNTLWVDFVIWSFK